MEKIIKHSLDIDDAMILVKSSLRIIPIYKEHGYDFKAGMPFPFFHTLIKVNKDTIELKKGILMMNNMCYSLITTALKKEAKNRVSNEYAKKLQAASLLKTLKDLTDSDIVSKEYYEKSKTELLPIICPIEKSSKGPNKVRTPSNKQNPPSNKQNPPSNIQTPIKKQNATSANQIKPLNDSRLNTTENSGDQSRGKCSICNRENVILYRKFINGSFISLCLDCMKKDSLL